MALPDCLIIGAMKCGTSTLAAQLGAQDGMFMTTPKEPNFFSDDAVHARGLAWYERLFAEAAPGAVKGEASTHYTKLPTNPRTVARMRAVLALPRLVYMVRDPVDRAVSHYMHGWTEGQMGDDPVAAFENHPELVDYGLYARQLAPFIDAYASTRSASPASSGSRPTRRASWRASAPMSPPTSVPPGARISARRTSRPSGSASFPSMGSW
jgi:hypothetical protein